MHQFTLIKDRPQLNTVNAELGKTPLKFYAEFINKNIFKINNFNKFSRRLFG